VFYTCRQWQIFWWEWTESYISTNWQLKNANRRDKLDGRITVIFSFCRRLENDGLMPEFLVQQVLGMHDFGDPQLVWVENFYVLYTTEACKISALAAAERIFKITYAKLIVKLLLHAIINLMCYWSKEMDMGWVHPWVRLGWVGLDWIGWCKTDPCLSLLTGEDKNAKKQLVLAS